MTELAIMIVRDRDNLNNLSEKRMADDRETEMKQALQGIIDNTEELIGTIGRMDWERIETLGEEIARLAMELKILSRVN